MQRKLAPTRAIKPTREPKASWESVVGPIQRRRSLVTKAYEGLPDLPPIHHRVDFPAPLNVVLGRLWRWVHAFFAFVLGTARDRFHPGYKDTSERRAHRLYSIIKEAGGSFLKIGQQLAIRVDLLPYEYYSALSKLFDEVEPIAFEEAIRLIEKDLRRPLDEVFSRFDPVPVGSGSMAVIYQAILREDDVKVAVKVRRPDIGGVVTADFSIMRALFILLKFVNLLPPTFTFEALDEIHDILIEELDFYWEARHTDVFRTMAENAPRDFFSAPKVYFKYSSENIVVQEFITGIPLKDMLLLVEAKDQEALEIMKEYDINPQEVGRRLLWVNYYTLWRSLFFHADPHPGNIIVLPHNQLVFVDFGAIGSLSTSLRWSLQQVYEMELQGNIEGAAMIALTLMEPLPALDINKLLEDVKLEFQRAAVALRSHGVPWTERTSAQLWFGFFRVARKYGVPLPSAVVRMVRGTMLYDTLAARLNPDLDIHQEYMHFRADAGYEARDNVKGAWMDRLRHGGLTPEDYLRLEQLMNESEQIIFQARRALHDVNYNIAPLVTRLASAIGLLYSVGFRMLMVWGLPFVIAYAYYYVQFFIAATPDERLVVIVAQRAWQAGSTVVLNSNLYWTFAFTITFLILIVMGRRLMSRLYQLGNDN